MSILVKGGNYIPNSLDQLFDDDDLGLLVDVKPLAPKKTEVSGDEELQEYLEFIRAEKRFPSVNSDSRKEKIAARKLDTLLRAHPELRSQLDAVLDEVSGADEEKSYSSLDDIFNDDDDLDLLGDVGADDDLLITKNRKNNGIRSNFSSDDKIAQSEPCKNFKDYEPYFAMLKAGFQQKHLQAIRGPVSYENGMWVGTPLILRSVTAFIIDRDEFITETNQNKNLLRVQLVYENGTTKRPFNTTVQRTFNDEPEKCYLVKATDDDGRILLSRIRHDLGAMNRKQKTPSGQVTGYIYILQSASSDPVLTEYVQNSALVKVGFCTTTVEQRIAHAEQDSTYLCAPVKIVKTYTCRNFDPHRLERLVHAFLGEHRLNVTLKDHDGKSFRPREWFTVKGEVAAEVVERIMDQTISRYYLDPISGRLRRKG